MTPMFLTHTVGGQVGVGDFTLATVLLKATSGLSIRPGRAGRTTQTCAIRNSKRLEHTLPEERTSIGRWCEQDAGVSPLFL